MVYGRRIDAQSLRTGLTLRAQRKDAKLAAQPRRPAPRKAAFGHLPTNLVIESTPEGAKGTAYVFLLNFEPGTPPAISAGGVYEDVIVKTPDGCRFKKRSFSPFDAQGALSQVSEGAAPRR